MSTFESKEIFVKAHVRIIRQKSYRFVCKLCNQVSERICFPSQPLYCERCRPPKSTGTKVERTNVIKPKRKRATPNVDINEAEVITVEAIPMETVDAGKTKKKKSTQHKATTGRKRMKK
jgi:hypothetical protein